MTGHRSGQFRRVLDVANSNPKALRHAASQYCQQFVLIAHERRYLVPAIECQSKDAPPAIAGGAEQKEPHDYTSKLTSLVHADWGNKSGEDAMVASVAVLSH
jgi:hypothetical protein